MIDDDEKTRRNLVTASAAVVLLYWLDVPIGRQIERVLGIQQGVIADWKMLVAAFVLIAYLSLRYNFSGEGSIYRSAMADEFNKLRFQKVMWLTQYMVSRYAKLKVESPIFCGQLSEAVKEFLKSTNTVDLFERGRLVLISNIREQGETPWKHRISVAPTIYENGGIRASSTGSIVEINITQRKLRWLVNAWAYVQAHFYSEPAIKAGMPVYFGLIAALTLWSRLLATL